MIYTQCTYPLPLTSALMPQELFQPTVENPLLYFYYFMNYYEIYHSNFSLYTPLR